MYKLSITDYNIPFAAVKVYDKKESEVAVFTSAGAKVSNPNTDGNGECELYVEKIGSYVVKVNGCKFFAIAGVEAGSGSAKVQYVTAPPPAGTDPQVISILLEA